MSSSNVRTSYVRVGWWLVALVVLVLGLYCFWRSKSSVKPLETGVVPPGQAAAVPEVKWTPGESTPLAAVTSVLPAAKRKHSETALIRGRVLAALKNQRGGSASPEPADVISGREGNAGAPLQDRTGELDPATMDVMNRELMPLVQECIDQAHARDPALRGMLAVDINLAGAEEVGTVIETAEPTQGLMRLAISNS